MNSILGIWGQTADQVLQRMGHRLDHRGSDLQTQRLSEDLVFGCNTAGSKNSIHSEQGYSIVCDADIYNKSELRAFLISKNIAVRSDSESELLLNLYRVGGISALERVNGDFAFAVWDPSERRVVLGRDYCGCRPLYHALIPGGKGMAFASEYKALLAIPGMSQKPDLDMLQCLQYHKKLPVGRTLLNGIFAPVPGGIEMFDSSGNRVDRRKMASIPARDTLASEDEAVAEVRRALSKAIECRVNRPDRIGVALSGGIDSIGIAFICRSLFPHAEIHTFTAHSGKEDHEATVAERVAKCIGAIHHAVATPPSLIKDHLEQLVWHLEDPFARSESLQLLKIGQTARAHVDALLCGMEADALFAGMPRHRILWLMSKWPLVKQVLAEIYDLTQSGLQPDCLVGKLLERSYFRNKSAPVPRVEGSQYAPVRTEFPKERHQLVSSFLSRVFQDGACQDGQKLERTFAAWGVRYQSPFLDRNVISAAFSVPDALKFKNGKNKYLLRTALQAWVPDEFRHVPKRPQRMRYDLEFARSLDEAADHYLGHQRSSRQRIFSSSDLSNLKALKRNGVYPAEGAMRLWTAILTQIWFDKFAMHAGDSPPAIG
jgi:asparagine synthase (glutamine-hydrolysing)